MRHIDENIQYILFGCGKNFYSYVERLSNWLPLTYYSDNNSQVINKVGRIGHITGIQVSEITLLKNPYVIIATDSQVASNQIKQQFDEAGIPNSHISDILRDCDVEIDTIKWPQKIHEDKISKFIDIDLEDTTTCNFRCEYCYVWRKKDFSGGVETSKYSVAEIRKGLSKEVLGGTCFVNLCARGETMLSKDIVELTYELLDEGHYVSIVTNGTIRRNILKLLQFPDEFQERLFLKISFL